MFENVAFPLREHTDLTEAMIRDIVLMKLNAVGLRGAAPLRIAEISGGMARRVALARAIALDPELIMYDEPFAGLDPISMGVAANLIRTLNDTTGATSLVVSHDVRGVLRDLRLRLPDVVAGQGASRTARPEQLAESQDPEVRQFIRGEPDGPVRFHYPAPPLAEDLGCARDRGLPAPHVAVTNPVARLGAATLEVLRVLGHARRSVRRAGARLRRGVAPPRPGRRPDPCHRQPLAGHHRRLGPGGRLRAGAADVLRAGHATARPSRSA